MDQQEDRQTYGTFVVLWDPDFDAMRAAMEEIEQQIEHHKDEIDPATIVTKVRYGEGPFDIYVSWQAEGRKPVEEKKPPKEPHPVEYLHIEQLMDPFKDDKFEIAPVVAEIQQKILALAVEKAELMDKTVHDAIVKAAKEDGVSDLFLFDREFVATAIREKMEREGLA